MATVGIQHFATDGLCRRCPLERARRCATCAEQDFEAFPIVGREACEEANGAAACVVAAAEVAGEVFALLHEAADAGHALQREGAEVSWVYGYVHDVGPLGVGLGPQLVEGVGEGRTA